MERLPEQHPEEHQPQHAGKNIEAQLHRFRHHLGEQVHADVFVAIFDKAERKEHQRHHVIERHPFQRADDLSVDEIAHAHIDGDMRHHQQHHDTGRRGGADIEPADDPEDELHEETPPL